MPVQVRWDSPAQTQILVELSTPMVWRDFQVGIDQTHLMIKHVDQTVDIIIWAKAVLPDGFALPQFRTAFLNQPKNVGRVIVVPEEKPRMLMFFKRLATVIQKAFPTKSGVIFADTIEQARSLNPNANSKPA